MSTYALITGASKGIGKSIAYILASRKYNLLLVARSEDDLLAIKNDLVIKFDIGVEILTLDLSDPASALQVKEWVDRNSYPVSILVNNAGYGLWGEFEHLSKDQQLNMLQLNITTVVELTYYILPLLKAQKESYILNVSSTAAYQAVPTLALYAASKAFILSFTRALRFELKNSSVSVSCLCPGPVNTGFAERAGLNGLSQVAQKFNMNPDQVAATAVKGLFNKKSEIIPGITNMISAYGSRFFPKSLIEKIAAGIYKL
ncbi:SDR family NAD(P)-dependent oxidoreductase [Arcticibacter eurypsychrophilus]|uniref:SDR family NAD(P)-dependent oxidoreductase n=1 Tax=Arcticibacter eurypsychrophilus TaxID=1434752 RepID=UPI00084D2847|nr:SDR family oxidoreductase [Arcticibacter eurypsychrophilus]